MSTRRAFVSAVAIGATLLGAAATGVLPAGAVQDATPAAEECPAGTPEENKALVTQWFEIVGGEGDFSTVLHEEHVHYLDSGVQVAEPGHEDIAAWAEGRLRTFPDLTMTVDQMVAEGDMIAALFRSAGTHEGTDEQTGAAATGASAEWAGAIFFRIECGKIVESWSVSDTLGRLQDLGLITEEEITGAEAAATPAA